MTLGVRIKDSSVDCKDLMLRVPPFEGFRGLSTRIFRGFHGLEAKRIGL
jgi:hypothetical protein